MRYFTSKKTAELLGVHPNTLRNWSRAGKIEFIKTPAGQRLYNVEAFIERMEKEKHLLKSYSNIAKNLNKNKDKKGERLI